VVERLASHLQVLAPDRVTEFFLRRYTLLSRGLRQAILAARARTQRADSDAALRRHLATAFEAFQADTGAQVRAVSPAVDAALAATRYRLPMPPQHGDLDQRAPAELFGILLELDPAPLARRLVKDAVMANSPLHAAVGEATDLGIRVHPRTQVTRGTPDPTKYEAGTLLVAVGAGGSHPRTRPWQIRLLRPRD
jgi:hypothetical protein